MNWHIIKATVFQCVFNVIALFQIKYQCKMVLKRWYV